MQVECLKNFSWSRDIIPNKYSKHERDRFLSWEIQSTAIVSKNTRVSIDVVGGGF